MASTSAHAIMRRPTRSLTSSLTTSRGNVLAPWKCQHDDVSTSFPPSRWSVFSPPSSLPSLLLPEERSSEGRWTALKASSSSPFSSSMAAALLVWPSISLAMAAARASRSLNKGR